MRYQFTILVFAAAAGLGFQAQVPGQLDDRPNASLNGPVITLRSGATFRIPDALFTQSAQVDRFTTYLTRADLERVRNPNHGGWETTFVAVTDATLPFASCQLQIGTEPFEASRKFGDLLMRLYVVREPAASVLDRVATAGVEKVRSLFKDVQMVTVEPPKAFERRRMTFAFRESDYGASALVDVYAREFGAETVVMVFMHAESRRWSWGDTITLLVNSFAWPGRVTIGGLKPAGYDLLSREP